MTRVRTVRVVVAAAATDAVVDVLWQHGALAVEERDGELVTAFADDATTDAVVARLTGWPGVAAVGTEEHDDAYLDAWRAHARPVPAGARLVVVPAWWDGPVPAGRLVVRLDPGRAFGSGAHPTTRLVLAALERHLGPRVLDVGCGSGVLALAAAALSATTVDAVDVDPEARTVTVANATAAGLAVRVAGATVDAVTGPYDVVLANLGAATLVGLAGALEDRTRVGGVVVASGVLAGTEGPVLAAFERSRLLGRTEADGWVALELQRTR